MGKKHLNFLKVCLFAAGLLLSAMIGLWLPGIYPDLLVWRRALSCATVISVYLGAAAPLFLTEINHGSNLDSLFTGGAVYYRGIMIYALISLVGILLNQFMTIRFSTAVLIQAIAVFVWLLYAYCACAAGHATSSVALREKKKTEYLDQMREKMQVLKVKAEQLDEEQKSLKEMMRKLCDSVRYLSPSDQQQAVELERQMLLMIEEISMDPVLAGNRNSSEQQLKEKLKQLELLYKQRKNVY